MELESDYKNIVGPALLNEVDTVKDTIDRADAARRQFYIYKKYTMSHSQIKGVDDVIEIESDSDSDEDDNDYSVYMQKLLKKEDVNSSDDDSDSEYLGYKPNEVFVEDVINGDGDI